MIGNTVDLITFAQARGETIDPDLAAIYLINATDYLDNQTWAGDLSDPDQDDSWPRSNVQGVTNGTTPKGVIRAAYMLAIQSSNGIDLMPSAAGGRTIKQATVTGAVSVTYDDASLGLDNQPSFPWLDSLIGRYLGISDSSPFNAPVWRAGDY